MIFKIIAFGSHLFLGGFSFARWVQFLQNSAIAAQYIKTLATKDDLAKAVASVKDDIANVRYDLRKEISESKADNIKWMFIFWIGQVGAILGIIFLFFKK